MRGVNPRMSNLDKKGLIPKKVLFTFLLRILEQMFYCEVYHN